MIPDRYRFVTYVLMAIFALCVFAAVVLGYITVDDVDRGIAAVIALAYGLVNILAAKNTPRQ